MAPETAQREHLSKLLTPDEVEAVMCVRAVRDKRLHEFRTFFDGRDVVFDTIERRRPMRGADAA
ncbi:MAG TPA: hypothetical protein VF576_01630 [Rubricoccaceae bacterium]|jgi:hypothetical protein